VSFASVLLAQLVDCQLSAEIVMRLQRPLNINWRFVKALRVDQRLYNNIYVLRWTFSINLVYIVQYSTDIHIYTLIYIYLFALLFIYFYCFTCNFSQHADLLLSMWFGWKHGCWHINEQERKFCTLAAHPRVIANAIFNVQLQGTHWVSERERERERGV